MGERNGSRLSESLPLRVRAEDQARVARLLEGVRGVRPAALIREVFLLGLERAEQLGPGGLLVTPRAEGAA